MVRLEVPPKCVAKSHEANQESNLHSLVQFLFPLQQHKPNQLIKQNPKCLLVYCSRSVIFIECGARSIILKAIVPFPVVPTSSLNKLSMVAYLNDYCRTLPKRRKNSHSYYSLEQQSAHNIQGPYTSSEISQTHKACGQEKNLVQFLAIIYISLSCSWFRQ